MFFFFLLIVWILLLIQIRWHKLNFIKSFLILVTLSITTGLYLLSNWSFFNYLFNLDSFTDYLFLNLFTWVEDVYCNFIKIYTFEKNYVWLVLFCFFNFLWFVCFIYVLWNFCYFLWIALNQKVTVYRNYFKFLFSCKQAFNSLIYSQKLLVFVFVERFFATTTHVSFFNKIFYLIQIEFEIILDFINDVFGFFF